MTGPHRVLAGPPASAGPETLAAHRARLGPLPTMGAQIIEVLESSGLLGRGGAGFPVGRKWRSVAERSDGHAVVVANGAEGEPRSAKDRTLMALRPHLVLDGALLAADAVGADELILYVGTEHGAAQIALDRAVRERGSELWIPIRLEAAPIGYVSGEATAAVHYLDAGDARPITSPPRPSERGVHGRPTLVQNVESLAHAALIARNGDAAYRELGRGTTRGSALVTISGAVEHAGVLEIEYGTPLGEVAVRADGRRRGTEAVLVGGYYGGWLDVADAWELPLDPVDLRDRGSAFGCGLISLLPAGSCGVAATAGIMRYMAASSAAQCGPCLFGLHAIAEATQRLADGNALPVDLERIDAWSRQLVGRGACHHPDGAVGLLQSSLRVFDDEFAAHARGQCSSRERDGRGVA